MNTDPGLLDPETLRYAENCIAQCACRVLWLRQLMEKHPDKFTPELRQLLIPFTAPLPDEKNLLSSNRQKLDSAIRATGVADFDRITLLHRQLEESQKELAALRAENASLKAQIDKALDTYHCPDAVSTIEHMFKVLASDPPAA